jgi:hypothetical protein
MDTANANTEMQNRGWNLEEAGNGKMMRGKMMGPLDAGKKDTHRKAVNCKLGPAHGTMSVGSLHTACSQRSAIWSGKFCSPN